MKVPEERQGLKQVMSQLEEAEVGVVEPLQVRILHSVGRSG